MYIFSGKIYLSILYLKNMHFNIAFSWPAGSGINTAWELLAQLLAEKWYSVWVDKEYASVIKGNNNTMFVNISDDNKPYFSRKVQIFIALDKLAISKNSELFEIENIIELSTVNSSRKNTFAFGIAVKQLNINRKDAENILEKKWFLEKDREGNLKALYEWIEFGEQNWWIKSDLSKSIWIPLSMEFGNSLIADWAAKAGLEFYSAYPMTPASTIINWVLKHPEITFQQWEDEIAVGMMMLGASYAWKRAMCWTSWGGFALMVESLAFANQAEIWWVYVLSQRDGPSTGTPTFVAQWDLDIALNAWFGETKPIVLAPSSYEEAYEMIAWALNWSEMYQHPVMFLVDKTLSECLMSVNLNKLKEPVINRGEIVKESDSDDYLRYKDTERWISPRGIPWTKNTLFIASSYEHTESWATNENPKIKVQQMEKRARKMETFKKEELKDWVAYEVINPNAKKFFITWWINRYPIEKVIEWNNERGLIVIKVFQPFDETLRKLFKDNEKQIEKLIFVELNHDWSCENYIRSKCGLVTDEWNNKIDHLRKYSLYPIMLEEVKEKMK